MPSNEYAIVLMFALPMMMPPAALICAIAKASSVGISVVEPGVPTPFKMLTPLVVINPATSYESFTSTGTPSRGY